MAGLYNLACHKIIQGKLMKKIVLSLFAMSMLLSAKDYIAPTFVSNSSVEVDENQLSAITLEATDPATKLKRWERRYRWYFGPKYQANTSTYSITSLDAKYFNINRTTGVVTFKVAPDYEAKSSYSFIAIATDASRNRTQQRVSINIIDKLEGVVDTTAPVITSESVFSVKENQTTAFTAMASDAVSDVKYSIFFEDSNDFSIDPTSTTPLIKRCSMSQQS